MALLLLSILSVIFSNFSYNYDFEENTKGDLRALSNYNLSDNNLKGSTISGIYINEFMASNNNISLPGHNKYDDWIEIRNTNNFNVDISGFYITDNLSNPTKRQLATAPGSVVVPKNGYLLLILSGNPTLGNHHVDLGLSASGEEIGLFDTNQLLVDSIIFGPQLTDISMGRNPSNLSEWRYFRNPTPGETNNLLESYIEIIPPPIFSKKGGVYTETQTVTIIPPSGYENATIYYTLDGSEPDINNVNGKTYNYLNYAGKNKTDQIKTDLYINPIIISDRSGENNRTSLKKSSNYISDYAPYNYKISKGTVLKAIAVTPDGLSLSRAESYFVFDSVNRYSLPMISISINEDYLFDYDYGMYTTGYYTAGSGWCADANYKMGWRYPGDFEFFKNGEQVINKKVDYKIHGGCSKTFPQKSLKIFSNDNFDYAFFENKPNIYHENIILRNGGNYWEYNMMKDPINQEVMRSMNFEIQENQPAIVFVNGEYWGIHNMRGKYDDNYIFSTYGIAKDSVDLIKVGGLITAEEGDKVAYDAMINFVTQNSNALNTSIPLYDSLVNSYIDINSFIDYYIAETYLTAYDWPHNNTRLWRKKVDQVKTGTNEPADGKWRWMLYDTEITRDWYSVNSLDSLSWNSHENSLIFRTIKNNPKFRESFSVRYADLFNTNFQSGRVLQIIDDYAAWYEPEVDDHTARWKNPKGNRWNQEIQTYKNFFTLRLEKQRSYLNQFYNYTLGELRKITVNVNDENQGYIKINTINILPTTPGVANNPYPWSGYYYPNLPTTLTAKAKKGFKFSHWLKNGSYFSSDLTITFNLTSSQTYTAVFEEYILSDNPYPLAKILDECGYSFASWSASAPENTYPEHMSFVYFIKTDPQDEDHRIDDELGGLYNMKYNLTSKNRINGLGNDGISFINTGSDLGDITNAKLGGALVAINTQGQDSVFVNWTGGTILKNDRKYRIRLQYRVGDVLDFKDVLDENGQVIEYKTNDTPGHEQQFIDILLPADALGQPYLQLLWRYFYAGNKSSGPRSQLRLDDILVSTSKFYNKNVKHSGIDAGYYHITSKATVKKTGQTQYSAGGSITLEPGFNTENKAVFKAEIKLCN